MFQGADYIFALTTKDYKFWKVRDGVVTVNAQPYFLDYAPAGRDDINVQNIRNKKYWGVDRAVSGPYTYVNDGAQILKYILLNKGMEEQVYLSVLEQQLYYEPRPKGTIAFTAGQTPFTPNTTTTGTITGTPGDTVKVRLYLNNPAHVDESIYGTVDSVAVLYDGFNQAEPVLDIVLPVSGVINFSIYFDQLYGGPDEAGIELLNENGTADYGYGYWYKQRTRTEFDLTEYSHEGAGIKITTLEDGLIKYLKANENTTIELPMDVNEAIYVKEDGIVLLETARYQDIDNLEFSGDSVGTDGFTPTYFIQSDGDHSGILIESQNQESTSSLAFPDVVTQTNCLIQNLNAEPLVLTITGKIEIVCTANTSPPWAFKCRFLTTASTVPTQNDYQIISTASMVVGTVYSEDISLTITLNQNERLYRQGIFFGGISGNPVIEFTRNSKFNVSFISRKLPTYIKAFRGQYLFQKYIEFVGEGNYTAAVSDFLETHSDKVFTCGNAIRGLDDAVFKWNFSGFFQFWDCFTSAGISEISGEIDIAEKKDLVDTSAIIDLPEPSNFRLVLAKDFLYNELEIGYPELKSDIGFLNANEEFNTKYLFSMGLMKKPNKIDKVSKINASSYSIEKIRITTVNKDTTDNKADNDIFPLVINNTLIPASGDIPAHYELDRSLNASATGLIEKDSVFNMALSPHLNFKRNGPWLRSLLWLCDYKNLKYQSVDKNNKLEFDDPVYGRIIEKADENIGGLGDQIFVPIIFEITVPPPDDLLETLDINPLQVYRFPFLGTYYKGILLEVSTGLASRKAQDWKLLALPDNDFKRLENYYG